jgi:hypothetical protein
METVEVTKSCRNEFKDIIKMTKDRCNRNKKKKKKKKTKKPKSKNNKTNNKEQKKKKTQKILTVKSFSLS